MSEQSSNNTHAVYILVIILSIALFVPIIYSFDQDWSFTGILMTICAIVSLVCGILGLTKEQENNEEAQNVKEMKERQEAERVAEEKRIESITDHTLVDEICSALHNKSSLSSAKKSISSMPEEARKLTLAAAFNRLLNEFLEDSFVDDEEEAMLQQFITQFKYTGKFITGNEQYSVFHKICQLKHFIKGEPLLTYSSAGDTINLQKNEQVIYEELMVDYYEDLKGSRSSCAAHLIPHPYGDSHYYERDGFEHSFVNTRDLRERAFGGRLILINMNIYYTSIEKTIKVPYGKVLKYTPYKEALCIQKDGMTAKPQIFTGVDGWFVFNIVKNIKV